MPYVFNAHVTFPLPSALIHPAFAPRAARVRVLWYTLVATFLAWGALTSHASAADPAKSEWVYADTNGKLAYKLTSTGDRIMDFSYAGYMGGGVALPSVPVKVTVQPTGGADDTAMIQAAIDQVSAMPIRDGFRGAVLLAPGTFICEGTLSISTSGVVLRGSGSSPGKTRSTIKLAGKPHLAIAVRAPGGRSNPVDDDTSEKTSNAKGPAEARTKLADAYVPSGALSFAVVDASGFTLGDTIAIRRPVTAAWVKLMGMDQLVRDDRPQTWIKIGAEITTERRIAALSGNRVTLDVPLSDSFDATYLNPPGTTVAKFKPPARVIQVGVENLHIESPPQEISHTEAHFTALRLNGQDCWARDLVIDETMNSVGVGGRRITLERVAVNRKARHQGSSKPAEFAPNASEVLLDRCSVHADNVWFIATGGGQAGPIVVLNADFQGNGRAEAHQRWSTGMLYDNCTAPDGAIEVRNRGAMGSGHGWAMAWGVIWNCVAKVYLVQNPPGAVNWIIGSRGHEEASPRPWGSGPDLPGGTVDSPGVSVAPRSLYLAQLAERLGPKALEAIGYSPSDIAPNATAQSSRGTSRVGQSLPPRTQAFGANLALDRPVLTSNMRGGQREFGGWQALDEDDQTCWATDDTAIPATLEFDTEGVLDINTIELEEAAGQTGHVRRYKVEGFVEGSWKLLGEGTSIGEQKVIRFPSVRLWKIKLTILKVDGYPAIRKLGIYHAKDASD